MVIHTLDHCVGEILLCYFFTRGVGVQFLPAGSTPQWEGGVVRAQHVLLARVLIFDGIFIVVC